MNNLLRLATAVVILSTGGQAAIDELRAWSPAWLVSLEQPCSPGSAPADERPSVSQKASPSDSRSVHEPDGSRIPEIQEKESLMPAGPLPAQAAIACSALALAIICSVRAGRRAVRP
ncbi:MAG TPA: hypothetical protein V6D08_17755 [Candidatus Obscuribacterales bacterium]